ncbi:MAG: PqqD family protein [Candidatus Riflebacteria bacterium]|nr:PqqD family protein [Candidatus Riflebacteria bacterium]
MFSRNQSILWTKLEEKVVLLDIERSRYYETNTLGAFIWEMLAKPHSITELVEKVVSRFRVDYEQCRCDIMKFLEDLNAGGLIKTENMSPEQEGLAKAQLK